MLLENQDIIEKIADNQEELLEIQMLGDFVFRYKGKTLAGENVRAKQVWNLLEYIMVNRHKEISADGLIDALWQDREVDDPANALKNLAYRLRTILKKQLDLPRNDYIVYKHGAYVWNPEIPCRIDVDVFENAYKAAQEEGLSQEEIRKYYEKAVFSYTGDLLPQAAYKDWIIPIEMYYQRIYMDATEKISDFLLAEKEYKEVEEIARNAIGIDPFVEANHENLIKAMIGSNQQKRAVEHYHSLCKLFYDELGIKPSDAISKLYQDAMDRNKAIEKDVSIIKEDLTEDSDVRGALCCNYEMFKTIYQLQARAALRSGRSIFIGLLTVKGKSSANLNKTQLDETVELFKTTIVASLRKDDVVARYGRTQFLVMFANITSENTKMVLNRLIEKINESNYATGVRIYGQMQTLDPVELERSMQC